MFLYTIMEAVVGIVAGILLAASTQKPEGVVYGKLDQAGRITNFVLILLYLCLSPLYLFIGMISSPRHEGILGILGWIAAIIIASAGLVCGIGLGLSVALRKKGKSKESFAVQFVGVVAIGVCVGLYCLLAGNLIQSLN